MKAIFYVYEHWRPDMNVCFYVGKGKHRRAYKFQRNKKYNAVVAALREAGLEVDVRIIAMGLSDEQAMSVEMARIAALRAQGIDLSNLTDGGEGFSGFVRPMGIPLSASARAKVSAARRGAVFSEEHRAKLAARKTGVKRRPFTATTIKKMQAAARERERLKRLKYGKPKRTSVLHARSIVPGFS